MLLSKKIHRKLPEYCRVVELMGSAFPADEQLPVWFLNLMAKREGIDFKAYYDAGDFDVSECERALGRLTFGVIKPKLKRA